jgi:hypothetical protein
LWIWPQITQITQIFKSKKQIIAAKSYAEIPCNNLVVNQETTLRHCSGLQLAPQQNVLKNLRNLRPIKQPQ